MRSGRTVYGVDERRALFRRRLHLECETLTRAGIDVHILEPDAATVATMGINALDNGRTRRVVRDSFLATGSKIADNPNLRRRLPLAPSSTSAPIANLGVVQ